MTLKGNKEIGEKLNIIIRKIAEANNSRCVIDVADFNSEDKLGKGKDMIDRLTKLIGIFEGLNLADNRADGDDLLKSLSPNISKSLEIIWMHFHFLSRWKCDERNWRTKILKSIVNK